MTSKVSAVFYTVSHRIEGNVLLNERLSEKLNDPLTDFLEIADVRMSSLTAGAEADTVQWPVATIPKATVLLATLDLDKHESRQTRIDKVQAKRGSSVGAVVGTIEVYGTGHIQFTGAPSRVLTSQLSPFFPVTEATIILSQREDNNRIETSVALVNRAQVQVFTLG